MLSHETIEVVLRHLNWIYGRGEIIHVDHASGKVWRKPFQCRPEIRRFRVVGRTVYFLSHQAAV
jgi:hypothetical protein